MSVADLRHVAALIQIAHALEMDEEAPDRNPVAFGVRASARIYEMKRAAAENASAAVAAAKGGAR